MRQPRRGLGRGLCQGRSGGGRLAQAPSGGRGCPAQRERELGRGKQGGGVGGEAGLRCRRQEAWVQGTSRGGV